MKRYTMALSLFVVCCVLLASGSNPRAFMQGPDGNAPATPTRTPDAKSVPTGGGMPPRALPSRPIPYHEPGRPSKAAGYTTQVTRLNAEGMAETAELTGLDAMLADETMTDPLLGNYRVVEENQLLIGTVDTSNLQLQGVDVYSDTAAHTLSLNPLDGTQRLLSPVSQSDVAAGDLNGDEIDEQLAAWLDNGGHLHISIGEMPVTTELLDVLSPKATSAPAAVAQPDGSIDLLVRGYDDALWYHDGASWQNAGGRLLSGPAVASRAADQLDVFAAGLDDSVEPNYLVVWHNQWDGANWAGWEALDNPDEGSPPLGWPTVERNVPTPELPAPAVVTNGSSQLDLFWLWPDNTLRWRHFGGTVWGPWVNLGGMLASGPGAVAHDGQIDVFARGVDDALWTRTYNGSWGSWQRVDRAGMPGGVTIASAPAAVSPAAGQVLVTVRGSDDRLWQLANDGSGWGDWNLAGLDKSTSGQAGQALGLDGVNDYVDLPDNFSNVTDFSFAAWVYWEGGNWWQRIFDFGQDTNTYMFLTPSQGTNMRFAIRAGGGAEQILDASTPLTQTEWVHVAVTLDGSTGVLYINGNAVDTQTITLTPQDVVGENTWLGRSQYVADPTFNGKIDKVVVFDQALSASEMADIYDTGWSSLSGKVLALHLDENPATHGTTLIDASSSGNDGTLYTFGSSKLAAAPAATAHGGQIDFFARTRDGHLGHALYDTSTWADWQTVPPLPDSTYVEFTDTGADTRFPVRVEAGHFMGAGRQLFAVAYVRNGDKYIVVNLYDIQDGFRPRFLDQYGLYVSFTESQTAPWGDGKFDMTTGDVDGDGSDEIVIASTERWHLARVRVDILDILCDDDSCTLDHFGVPGQIWYQHPGPGDHNEANIHVAAGDIDGEDDDDEVALVLAGAYYPDIPFNTYMYVFDNDPTTNSGDPFCGGYHGGECVRYNTCDPCRAADVAVGNFSGSQKDEIAWLTSGDFGGLRLFVHELKASKDGTVEKGQYGVIPGGEYRSDSGRVVVADMNGDLSEELAIVSCKSGTCQSYLFPHGTFNYSDTRGIASGDRASLAAGDFTGESLCVGPPTYRLESQVGGLIALINEPPKHFDTLDGVDYDINSTDSGTYASYENEQSQSTEMSLQVTRDWGLASGLEVTAGDPEGTHVTTSLNTTYGEHFENTTTAFKEITFGSSLIASHDDLADYSRTDYQVWEYPIYDDLGNTAAGYITVVFPQPVGNNQGTVEAFTPGSTCDFWYQPNHEINNVWSYPMDLTRFTDFDNDKGALNQIQVLTLGGVEGDFWTSWSDVTTENQASAVNLGVSAGVEAQVGGDKIPIIGYKIPWSVKASFEASYKEGTLSTQEVQGSDATTVHAHFNPIDPSASYEVTPYLYWSQDGYLVLDYVTDPIVGTSFWSRYDKADPAFIRPWSDGHCGTDRADFSKEIVVTPSFVNNGELITVSATVRNFSNVGTGNVKVRFYQGDPAQGGLQIGSDQVIATLDPRDNRKVSIQVPIFGNGEQHIYAVIDPDQQLTEMHRENNIAYGVVMMGASDYVDPGQVIQLPYVPLTFTSAIFIAAYTPPGNIMETTRFELKGSSLSVPSIVGEPFELLAYQGSSGGWDTPINDFDLKPQADDPPTVIAIAYNDADIAGMDEANLCLFRLSTNGWQEATCAGYAIERFPEDNLIAVPVCQAGVFALSAEILESFTFLPLVLRNAP